MIVKIRVSIVAVRGARTECASVFRAIALIDHEQIDLRTVPLTADHQHIHIPDKVERRLEDTMHCEAACFRFVNLILAHQRFRSAFFDLARAAEHHKGHAPIRQLDLYRLTLMEAILPVHFQRRPRGKLFICIAANQWHNVSSLLYFQRCLLRCRSLKLTLEHFSADVKALRRLCSILKHICIKLHCYKIQ